MAPLVAPYFPTGRPLQLWGVGFFISRSEMQGRPLRVVERGHAPGSRDPSPDNSLTRGVYFLWGVGLPKPCVEQLGGAAEFSKPFSQ